MSQKLRKLYKKLLQLKPILPGSISEQYNVCGKAGCRCKDKINPKRHGPQLKLGFRVDGKNSTLVVRKADGRIAKEMNDNFICLRKVQSDINAEALRVYKELGAEAAYAEIESIIADAKGKPTEEKSESAKLRQSEASRENWKKRAVTRGERLRNSAVTIRDLTSSRENWKEKAMSLKVVEDKRTCELENVRQAKAECDSLIVNLEEHLKKL